MDLRLERFLAMMPRGDTLSVLRAADILEGEHRAPELLHLVAIGNLLSFTHSSTGGSETRCNIRGQGETVLPRITPETDPKSVIVFSEDIVWRWCVEYEGWLQGVDEPPKDTVLAREAAVKLLAKRTTAPAPDTATPAPVAGKKWTPEKLAELKAYRETHTMPETAVKFRISEQRIRDLLPSQKPKAKPFAGVIHRMK